MKRKLLIVLLVITLVASIGLTAACIDQKRPDPTRPTTNKGGNIIDPLPDMIDYGADSKYYQDGTTPYSSTMKTAWTQKLEDKQDEERIDWLDSGDPTDWPQTAEAMKEFYVSFGAWAASIADPETEIRQSNVGYFDVEGNWVDDESANTVQRIFCK